MTLAEGDTLVILQDLERSFKYPKDYCGYAFQVLGQPDYNPEGYIHVVLKVLA